MTTSKVYVLMKVESYNKYDLKDVNTIGVYTDKKTAEEDLKKYEKNACDNITYCLQVSYLFKK